MSDAKPKYSLIEFLVASQLEIVDRREKTLNSLPRTTEYFERAACLRIEIAESKSRAARLNQMIDPMRMPYEDTVDQETAA